MTIFTKKLKILLKYLKKEKKVCINISFNFIIYIYNILFII